MMGRLLKAVLNLPGLNLTSRFAKPEVKYLVHLVCTKQVHHWFSITLRLVFKPKVKSFKPEFKAFPGTFNTVVCR